jgi:acetyltransferase-like isoleucine patch superfamily enzyme
VDIPRHARRIRLEDGVALDRGVTLIVSGQPEAPTAIDIGTRTYVNRHTIFDATTSIVIGADCMIGPFCYLTDHDHSRGSDGLPASGPLITKPVRLGDRCWLGAHVTVLKGVTIGDDVTIGAGTIVSRDIPSGATVVGNPARPISHHA